MCGGGSYVGEISWSDTNLLRASYSDDVEGRGLVVGRHADSAFHQQRSTSRSRHLTFTPGGYITG